MFVKTFSNPPPKKEKKTKNTSTIAKIGFLIVTIKRFPNVNKTLSRRLDNVILLPRYTVRYARYSWEVCIAPVDKASHNVSVD